jgi:hypothetical protein
MFILKCEGSIGPKTAAFSNGNNPRWIDLSMEIVALYLPVLTEKNEEHTYDSTKLLSRSEQLP